MSEIIPFAQAELPAHLANVFGAGNIAPKLTTNQLSYKGKTWRRVVDGEEVKLTKKNDDGDVVPVNIVNLVVLDHNKRRSRSFYEGEYVDGENKAPVCSSIDGVKPDAGVAKPQCATCAACPNSVKGSKTTANGKATTACAPNKRVAVVPSGVTSITEHPVLLLKLAQTSVWDKDNKENEAKGWYAWDQYIDMLRARGANHSAAVETRVKFDIDLAYPKLLFSASRWLTPEEALAAKARIDSAAEEISKVVNGNPAGDGVEGAPAPAERDPEAGAGLGTQAGVQAAGDDDDGVAAAAAAAAAKAKKAKAAEAAAAKAAEVEAARVAKEKADKKAALLAQMAALEAGDDEPAAPPAKPAVEKVVAEEVDTPVVKKAKAEPATVVEAGDAAPAGLSALMAGWDDE
jgi:hypothetical protein